MKKTSKFFLLSITLLFTSVFMYAQNVGVGTTSPNSKLQVSATAATDSVAFKVGVDNNTKLKVTSNGGVAVGTVSNPPANGLLVNGIIVPGDSIKSSTDPIYIVSVADSVVLRAGSTTIILSANGAVKINASGSGGISIDGGGGNVSIKGANVNISATAALNLTSSGVSTLNGAQVKLGSGGLPVARVGDQIQGVSANGFAVTGTIISGSPVVLTQ